MKKFNSHNKKEFDVPTDYFASLEESILNETKHFEEASCFDIPNNYYSELETSILNSTVNKKQNKSRRLWISISSVAACLVLFVVGYTQFNSSKESKNFVAGQKVDQEVEDAVYESLYKTYFVEDETKKSSNDISLDDLDNFYSEQQLSSNY